MSDIKKDIVLYRVAVCDYERVMKIRNPDDVYGGHDYLPSCFHDLLDSPNAMAFAAELDQQFIAFTLVNLIDDSKTFVFRANRVSKAYEGAGIMKWLLTNVENTLLKTTFVERQLSATVGNDKNTMKRLQERRCSIAIDREMKYFETSTLNLVIALESCKIEHSNVHEISEEKLNSLFDTPVCSLFGKGRIVVNWVPYYPIQSNISFITRETTSVIGSDLDNLRTAMVSFGTSYQTIHGLTYVIDLYGNVDQNVSSHIYGHIKSCLNSKYCNITIGVCYDKKIADEYFINVLANFNFTKCTIQDSGCLCVERKVLR